MNVIYGIGKVNRLFKNAVLAIGVFDGLHIGHQELIQRIVKRAKEIKGESIVLTFDPHPIKVLDPQRYIPLISTLSQRILLIEQMEVDHCLVVNFTKRFSQMSPESFIKRYIEKNIHPKEIYVGCDFRFGNNRSGTLDVFKAEGARYGFRLHVVHSIEKGNEKISSTHIRRLIRSGRLKESGRLLGRTFSIMGVVKKGKSRGTKLGFPTANIYPRNEIIPPTGVYAVNVLVGNKKYKGMANVGVIPTFNAANKDINVEAHIFHFKQNLVGKTIVVEFLKKIRDEKRFSSKKQLIVQIKKDEKRIKSIF